MPLMKYLLLTVIWSGLWCTCLAKSVPAPLDTVDFWFVLAGDDVMTSGYQGIAPQDVSWKTSRDKGRVNVSVHYLTDDGSQFQYDKRILFIDEGGTLVNSKIIPAKRGDRSIRDGLMIEVEIDPGTYKSVTVYFEYVLERKDFSTQQFYDWYKEHHEPWALFRVEFVD